MKAGCPVPSVSARESGFLQILPGGEAEGDHRAPVSPQQTGKEERPGEKMRKGPLEALNLVRGLFEDWDSRAPGLLSEVFVRPTGQGLKSKARGKVRAELQS